jgi:hypothetical protein
VYIKLRCGENSWISELSSMCRENTENSEELRTQEMVASVNTRKRICFLGA